MRRSAQSSEASPRPQLQARGRNEMRRQGMKCGKTILGSLLAAGALAASLALAGCGSSGGTPPVITLLAPSSAPAGSSQFVLAITGDNMNLSSFVAFGSDTKIAPLQILQNPCPTAPCPVTAIVLIPVNDVAAAGNVQVVVTTGGVASKPATFSVTSPQIVTLSPLAAPAGGNDFPLTLEVLNATQSIEVLFGQDKTPLVPAGPITCNPVTACAVTVTVPGGDIKTAGPLTVTVTNPLASSGGTAATNFLVANPGAGSFPALESANGTTPGNAASTHSSVSDGGVYVAFDSTATNLPGSPATSHSEVYVTANCFGAANCTAGTKLISAGSGGAAGAGGVNGSDKPAISPDGRFVVFESDDTNLVSSVTTPVEQIYLYDSCSSIFGAVQNCTPGLTLISADGSGNPGNAASANPAISGFGTYIAYQSAATNLTSATVPAGTQQVYLFSNCNGPAGAIAGCTKGTQLVSMDQTGAGGNANSTNAVIDPLGMAVAFQSNAGNIIPGLASNGFQQIYLRPTCLEAVPFLASCAQPAVLVSGGAGNQLGTSDSVTPAIGVGPVVAFATSAANLLPKASGNTQILAANVCLGLPATTQCTPSGMLDVSVDAGGNPGAGDSSNPAVNGVTAAFTSLADLKSGGTLATAQVYAATICLPGIPSCSPNAMVLSADSSNNPIGGDFAAIHRGFATFSSAGSSVAPGTPEIFLAIPPAPPNGFIARQRKGRLR
jgi:hypothetical protein